MRGLRGLRVIRSGVGVPTLTPVRAAGGGGDQAAAPEDGRLGTLEVMFSRFNTWYEIDSVWEGRFLERTVPGAFKRTIDQRGSQVKVLFNHGMDFNIGDKVLGVPDLIEERTDGPYLEAGLLDTSYNRDLLPGLRAGAYGSSFMFEVLGESWVREPAASAYNPEGLPERTITEVRLYEAGPVTWPANPDATAGVRSGMDWYASTLAERDADRYEDLVRSFAAWRALHGLRTSPLGEPAVPVEPAPEAPAPGPDRPARHVDGITAAARTRRLHLIDMARRGPDGSGRAAAGGRGRPDRRKPAGAA